MNFLQQYSVGDIVVAAVDHPEDNETLMKGDTGTVFYVGRSGILIDWDVNPGRGFHTGSEEHRLPAKTGWWVYHEEHIKPVPDLPPDWALDSTALAILLGEVGQ